MKEVKIVSDGHGRRIFVDGQELPNNKPDYIKQQIDKEGVVSLVNVDKMIRVRQKHQIGIVGGSFMSQEQKLTLATETKEGEDSRILTAQVNKKMGITD